MATTEETIEGFLSWLFSRKTLAKTTLADHRRHLRALASFAEEKGWGTLESLTEQQLNSYRLAKRNEPGQWSQRRAAIRGLFGYLQATGQREDNPAEHLAALGRDRRPSPRTLAHLGARLRKLSPEVRLVAEFLRETGGELSEHEAFSINEDVPAPQIVRVENQKGERRTVRLPETARRILDKLDGSMPWGPRTIQRRFKEAGFTGLQLRRLTRSAVTVELHEDQEASVLAHSADGEFEAAAMEAFKRVDKRIRALLPSKAFGHHAVVQAFAPNGPLGKTFDDPTERDRAQALFVGAFGFLRNRLGHEPNELLDPMYAREVLIAADLLMRLLDEFLGPERA